MGINPHWMPALASTRGRGGRKSKAKSQMSKAQAKMKRFPPLEKGYQGGFKIPLNLPLGKGENRICIIIYWNFGFVWDFGAWYLGFGGECEQGGQKDVAVGALWTKENGRKLVGQHRKGGVERNYPDIA
jgi:hypothetical protein